LARQQAGGSTHSLMRTAKASLFLGGSVVGGAELGPADAGLVSAGAVALPQQVLQALEAERLTFGDLRAQIQHYLTGGSLAPCSRMPTGRLRTWWFEPTTLSPNIFYSFLCRPTLSFN